jgi:hypothetical protein
MPASDSGEVVVVDGEERGVGVSLLAVLGGVVYSKAVTICRRDLPYVRTVSRFIVGLNWRCLLNLSLFCTPEYMLGGVCEGELRGSTRWRTRQMKIELGSTLARSPDTYKMRLE